MNKKGFTLVELLAVMIILSIILIIAVPQVLHTIDNAKSSAFEIDAKMVLQQINYATTEDKNFEYEDIDKTNFKIKLGISDNNYSSISFIKLDEGPYVILIGQGKWEGLKACGTKNNIHVVSVDDEVTCL